jgi:hypothetical protein
MSLAGEISMLANEAGVLADKIQSMDDSKEETRRRIQRLRKVFGMSLFLAEKLAQRHGEQSMLVVTEKNDDGSGSVEFEAGLSEEDIKEIEARGL